MLSSKVSHYFYYIEFALKYWETRARGHETLRTQPVFFLGRIHLTSGNPKTPLRAYGAPEQTDGLQEQKVEREGVAG